MTSPMVSSVRRRLVLFMSFTSVSTVKENYINVKHCKTPVQILAVLTPIPLELQESMDLHAVKH